MEPGEIRFPWAFYQQACLGALRWSPDQFWRSTLWEADRAIEGYRIANGIKKPETGNGMTEEKLAELQNWMRQYGDA